MRYKIEYTGSGKVKVTDTIKGTHFYGMLRYKGYSKAKVMLEKQFLLETLKNQREDEFQMERKIISGKIIDGEEYLMEQRGELEGFHHLQTGFFYAIKAINRDRLEVDAYLEEELKESFDCKRTKLLGELLIEDIHTHLTKEK